MVIGSEDVDAVGGWSWLSPDDDVEDECDERAERRRVLYNAVKTR